MIKLIVLLLTGLTAVLCDQSTQPNVPDGSSILLAEGSNDDNKCEQRFSCLDCRTARICRPDGQGSFVQVTTVPCPNTAPFCEKSSGTCTDVPDGNCGEEDTAFVCMENGYFPDGNCTNYHICNGFTASKYHCALNEENFDADTSKCALNVKCGTYECTEAGIKVPHSIYPQYFGYCNAPGAAPAVIDRCPGNYVLNLTSQQCEPVCKHEGVQEDYQDCTKYFRCHHISVPNGGEEWIKIMVRDHFQCPQNTAFSPDHFMCININETRCGSPPEKPV